MALDELEIVVDVMDSFSDELTELINDLEAADVVADDVDNIRIDVDAFSGELETLRAQLETLPENVTVDIDGDISNLQTKIESARVEAASLDTSEFDLETDFGDIEHPQMEDLNVGEDIPSVDGDMGPDLLDVGDGGGGGGSDGDDSSIFDALKKIMPDDDDDGGKGFGNLAMSDIHNAFAKLVPLLFVFIGAMGPAIAGIASLAAAAVGAAAALGGIAGLGLIGMTMQMEGDAMENLSTIAQDVQDDFMNAFGPLARELAPMFEKGLNGLSAFFNELAARGQVLMNFRDDAVGFGQFILNTIPNVIASLIKFADAMSPIFAMIGSGLQDLDLLESFAQLLADALPSLMMLTQEVIKLLGQLSELTLGFAKVAAAATWLINIVMFIVSGFGLFRQQLGLGIAAVLGLATAIGILSSSIFASLLKAMITAILYFIQFAVSSSMASAGAEMFGITLTSITIPSLQSLAVAAVAAAGALALLTGGLILVGGLAAAAFGGVASDIDNATKSLKDFKDVNSSLGSVGPNGGPSGNIYQFRPNQRQTPTVINADNVSSGKRVANTKSFRQGSADNADMR